MGQSENIMQGFYEEVVVVEGRGGGGSGAEKATRSDGSESLQHLHYQLKVPWEHTHIHTHQGKQRRVHSLAFIQCA